MSGYRNQHNNYRSGKPEDLVILLIAILIGSIFYPPLRQTVYQVWYIYLIAVLVFIFLIVRKMYYEYRISKSGIKEIDVMSGHDFEIFLKTFFSKLGYHVIHTGQIGDLGCDLIVEKDGIRIAVQAKRYTHHVGPDAVREIYTSLRPKNCIFGIVITNNYYTEEAKFLAKTNNVILWDRNDLMNNILKTK